VAVGPRPPLAPAPPRTSRTRGRSARGRGPAMAAPSRAIPRRGRSGLARPGRRHLTALPRLQRPRRTRPAPARPRAACRRPRRRPPAARETARAREQIAVRREHAQLSRALGHHGSRPAPSTATLSDTSAGPAAHGGVHHDPARDAGVEPLDARACLRAVGRCRAARCGTRALDGVERAARAGRDAGEPRKSSRAAAVASQLALERAE